MSKRLLSARIFGIEGPAYRIVGYVLPSPGQIFFTADDVLEIVALPERPAATLQYAIRGKCCGRFENPHHVAERSGICGNSRIQNDDAVHVIRHDNEFVEDYPGKTSFQFIPGRQHRVSRWRQRHPGIDHFTEQALSLLYAYGEEIRTRLCVVIRRETQRAPIPSGRHAVTFETASRARRRRSCFRFPRPRPGRPRPGGRRGLPGPGVSPSLRRCGRRASRRWGGGCRRV